MKSLKKVLGKCESEDLRLNSQKCKFGQFEVNYVGHVFEAQGLKANQDRIQGIQNTGKLQRFTMVTWNGELSK